MLLSSSSLFHTTARWQQEDLSTAPATETSATATLEAPPPAVSNEIVWTRHRLNKEQIAKVDSIFHKILWLDSMETALLTASINYKLGLHLTPAQQTALERQLDARLAGGTGLLGGGGGSTEAAAAAEAEPAAPKVASLKLVAFDEKAKIKVIKEVRAIAGLGLKESKELVESVPALIQKYLKPEKAAELKVQLEAVGATVELV